MRLRRRNVRPSQGTAALLALAACGLLAFVMLSLPVARPVNANALDGVTAAAGGAAHTCAIVQQGAVDCWGWNLSGQVGDGTTTNRPFPAAVPGISGATLLATGAAHSCVYVPSAGVECWGLNVWGQLGAGSSSLCRGFPCSTGPIAVAGLTGGVVSIGAGMSHTCVLTAAGGVMCWGRNQYGQLGNGTNTNSGSPVDVSGLDSGVKALAVGAFFNCALLTGGTLKCWGNNATGQLGDGTTTNSSVPVEVSGLPGAVASVSAGVQHVCALLPTGGLLCWGDNVYGSLGDGTTVERHQPVAVSGLDSGVAVIIAANGHTCALLTSGGLKCWGQNGSGEIGNGDVLRTSLPVNVLGLESGVAALWRGFSHTCATTAAGVFKCWGDNVFGQLGVETKEFCAYSGASCSTRPLDVLASPKATPTPLRSATPTSTPAPPALPGDVDCDDAVTSLDAALILQFAAGLLDALPCPAAGDVNGDGVVDAIDAALVLQYVAGLLDALPP